ncbi:phage tail tape measure protein [Spartinivicinus ruber]|uniref:phage tail tape measure protein n=1 Tax=Spartinivicinus ruber TaxID=2683272 RepID=UPI0013D5E558|nr:phage tail tape measure protein [Spartinivicinus ruber]
MPNAQYSIAIAAIDRFSAPLQSYQRTTEQLTSQLREQRSEVRRLNAVQRDMSSYDRLQRQMEDTSRSLSDARLEQRQLAQQMRDTQNPSRQLTRHFDRANRAVTQLNAQYQTQTNRLDRLQRELSDAGVDTNRLVVEQIRMAGAVNQANNALESQQQRMQAVNQAQARIDANQAERGKVYGAMMEVAAAGYLMAQPVRKAIDYESSFADVKKVVDFDGSKGEDKQMASDILKLSTKIPMAADGLSEIIAAGGQSNIAKGELLNFATSAAKMGVAFDIEAEEAGKTMAAWRSAMGLNQDRAIKLADATNYLSNNLSAEAKDIAGVMKRQGSVAMSSGFSEVQAASFSAALLSGGAAEEVAATALKNITGAMSKGKMASKRQKQVWGQLGFDPELLAGEMLQDAPNTIIRVFEAFQDMPEEEISALVSALFGEESKGAVMPLIKNLDNLKNAFKLTGDESRYLSSMEKEYQARSATTANNLELLGNSFDRLFIVMGDQLLPVLNDIVDPLTEFINSLADAAEEYPTVAKTIGLIGAGGVALIGAGLAIKLMALGIGQGINYLRRARARLGGTTATTATQTQQANTSLRQLNNTLAGTGRGNNNRRQLGANCACCCCQMDGGGRRRRRGRRNRGRSRRGRLSGRGRTLPVLPNPAAAVTPGIGRRLLQGAGRVVRPLGVGLAATALADAAMAGDATEAGGQLGDIAGSLSGAMAGGAMGAAVGSVVPVVGTVIGGAIGSVVGGIAGSSLGKWIGEGVGSWFDDDDEKETVELKPKVADIVNQPITDKLPSPEKVSQQIVTNNNHQQVSPTFNLSFMMPPGIDPNNTQALADSITNQMQSQVLPLMASGQLAERLDGSLSDRNND